MKEPDYEELLDSRPPDARPPKKGPGRPKGSRNKPKAGPPAESRTLESFLSEPEATVRVTGPSTAAIPDPDVVAEHSSLKGHLEPHDFRAFGTRPRIVVVAVQDATPSVRGAEDEWRAGSRAIPEEIRKVPAARNLIDVIFCTGAESFSVVSVAHGKDFAFPAGAIKYGTNTLAKPWLAGIRAAAEAYKSHLAGLGIGVRDVVVVIASDFCFGDDFRADLKAFKVWAKANSVTVVPAGFGSWNEKVAAEFGDVPPVHLKELSLARFFRILSQSVVRASQTAPGKDEMARELSRGLNAAKVTTLPE